MNVADFIEQRQEVRELFREQFVHRALGVDREAEDLGQDIAFRESYLLWIDSGAGYDGIDQILLVLAIHNRETAGISESAAVPPQHAIAHRMKGAAPKSAGIDRQQIGDAIEHLPRGF